MEIFCHSEFPTNLTLPGIEGLAWKAPPVPDILLLAVLPRTRRHLDQTFSRVAQGEEAPVCLVLGFSLSPEGFFLTREIKYMRRTFICCQMTDLLKRGKYELRLHRLCNPTWSKTFQMIPHCP